MLAKSKPHGTLRSSNNEWYTPLPYIELARRVLGPIDLDPASSAEANDTVWAARYFTETDNGLAHEWHGAVWVNPPYERGLIDRFVEKLVAEYDAGRTTSAILLVHSKTDTAWWHFAADTATAMCFTRKRIRFMQNGVARCQPTHGSVFFYYGNDPELFREVFASVGSAIPLNGARRNAVAPAIDGP